MKRTILILTALLLQLQFVWANESRTITGTVTDQFGNPIQGVTVSVENSQRSTLSNQNGMYRIEVLKSDKFLVFSFVGKKQERVEIKNQKVINISMLADEKEIEELVVEDESEVRIHPTSSLEQKARQPQIMIRGVAPKSAAFYIGGGVAANNWNTENYAAIRENGFKNVQNNPLSTFSIDVDNASYSNIRRYINRGSLPPKDAVRIEEMINYFNYNYPAPEANQPFRISSELATCPWNSNHYLFHVGLKARDIDKSEIPASNLVFLLDVSGSMNSPDKLPLLKRAFGLLINELRPADRVAIVVYAGAAGVVLESTPGSEKGKISEALNNLSAGGSTAGGQGIKLAYKIAKQNLIEGGNNRIILATDGDFNVGVSSTSEMERLVEKERNNGVFMSVIGFGTGNIKDDKMETIADKGNGNYSYIDNIQEARKVFITEFGGTLFAVAKDVKFQVEFNPAVVKAYRLVGYENRLLNDEDFNDDTKDAGEMGAGHTVTALYEIIPANSNEETPQIDPLKYQQQKKINENNTGEILTLKVRYKKPDGNKSRLIKVAVKNELQKHTSDNFRFSAAVAEFGMLLRDSEFKANSGYKSVIDLARNAKGNDEEGYRAGFIQLVKMVDILESTAENN